MVVEQKVLHAQAVLDELKRCGVSHVVWLPDHDSQHMFQTLQQNPDLTLVQVCREGEAMPIALGLLLGGKTPAVLIQNTGVFESGDSIRGIGIDLKLPLVTLIAWRGYEGEGQPMSDTAGLYIEPMLNTWGIPYQVVDEDAHTPRIAEAFRQAEAESRLVAILVSREYR